MAEQSSSSVVFFDNPRKSLTKTNPAWPFSSLASFRLPVLEASSGSFLRASGWRRSACRGGRGWARRAGWRRRKVGEEERAGEIKLGEGRQLAGDYRLVFFLALLERAESAGNGAEEP